MAGHIADEPLAQRSSQFKDRDIGEDSPTGKGSEEFKVRADPGSDPKRADAYIALCKQNERTASHDYLESFGVDGPVVLGG